VHHAVSHERVILTVVEQRQVEHLRVFAGAAHEVVVLHAMAVVCDGHHAGLFQAADGGEFFAGDVFCDRAGDEDIDHAFAFRAFVNERTVPAESIAGDVLGMQTTEVKPPRAAAAVPLATFSLAVWPGSRKWTCKSIRPGETIFPVASKVSTPAGAESFCRRRRFCRRG